MGFQFYDEGWSARCQDQPFNIKATRDWKDGWRDCNEVDREEQNRGRDTLRDFK